MARTLCASTCSCGTTKPHILARRSTFDGNHVLLWSDGGVTGALGVGLYGAPARERRNHANFLAGGWLALGEVELYDAAEVRKLLVTARRAVAQRNLPPLDYLRRQMAGQRFHSDGRVIRAHTARCQCPGCLRERMTAGLGLEPRHHR